VVWLECNVAEALFSMVTRMNGARICDNLNRNSICPAFFYRHQVATLDGEPNNNYNCPHETILWILLRQFAFFALRTIQFFAKG
jgi:hypothetical protein